MVSRAVSLGSWEAGVEDCGVVLAIGVGIAASLYVSLFELRRLKASSFIIRQPQADVNCGIFAEL